MQLEQVQLEAPGLQLPLSVYVVVSPTYAGLAPVIVHPRQACFFFACDSIGNKAIRARTTYNILAVNGPLFVLILLIMIIGPLDNDSHKF
jgi:hypothetical protein